MNAKRRTGYGVFDITRQVARRIQKEWETVENPPMRILKPLAPLEPVHNPARPLRPETRPLAA